MTAMEQVQQLCGDYRATKGAFGTAMTAAQDVKTTVEGRLVRERAQDTERAEELRAVIADLGRAESVRRMASDELSQLKARTYAPTAAEIATFDAEAEKAEAAERDLQVLRSQMRDALESARTELDAARKATLGDPQADLLIRWITSEREKFASLGLMT